MTLTAKSLADVVVASTQESHAKFALTLVASGSPPAAVSIPATYCSLWKTAKPVIASIAGIAMWIPGFGATVAGVLGGLVKVGDLIAAEMGCA